jgi:HK97 gp10 family phage protein
MKTSVIITGIRDIDRKLKRLAPAVQKKVVRKAMRAGLKVQATEVRSQVPVDTGLTKSAVKVRAVKRKKRGTIELEVLISGKVPGLIVTPASGAKPVFYPAVVEYGTSERPPNPFMRRAYESKGEAAKLVTLQVLRDGIEAEAVKG